MSDNYSSEGFVPPRAYETSEVFLSDIERRLGEVVAAQTQSQMGAIILASPDPEGYFGTLGRRLEVLRGFAEMPHDMHGLESASRFIYMFDKCVPGEEGSLKVTHSTRFLEPSDNDPWRVAGAVAEELEGQVDIEEVARFHKIQSPLDCLYTTTDLSVPGIFPTRTKPYGLLAFRTLFQYSVENGYRHMFAYANKHTIRALGRLGISPTPLCGRSNYAIPPVAGLTFEAYQPYVVSMTQENVDAFTNPEQAAKSRWGAMVMQVEIPTVHLED